MRRIVIAVAATISVLVLLFSFSTSRNQLNPAPASARAVTTTSGSGSGSSADPSTGTETGSSPSAATVYTGAEVDTRWGIVQVEISVRDGRIVSASAIRVPDGNSRDIEINNYAVPLLNESVIDTQSADIDMISGATVTSEGYLGSLQSALDQAGLS